MSLLSDTQGRPHTVRSLVRSLKSLGNAANREELYAWFLPGDFSGDHPDNQRRRFSATIGCARSLGWVGSDDKVITLTNTTIPDAPVGFSDALHYALHHSDKPEDRRILEAFAFVVLRTEKEGESSWLKRITNKQLASDIDDALREGAEGGRLFNKDKIAAWKVWLQAMGLAWDSRTIGYLIPDVTERLSRTLPALMSVFEEGKEIPPQRFVAEVGLRMPYLDTGSIFKQMSENMQQPFPANRISRVLARAMLELEFEGELSLEWRGDAIDGMQFPRIDTHSGGTLVGVTLC